jgi:ubiquinone/menaquinone biosynthesis C-methylase UbiE
MKKTEEIKRLYEDFCIDYDKHMNETMHYQAQLHVFNELIDEIKEPILDLACGPGFLLKEISKKFSDVMGNDFSEEMIKIAKQKNPNLKFSMDDAEELVSHSSSHFNTIIFSNLFFYIQNKPKALKRWREVLTKKGKLIMMEEYPFTVSKSSSKFCSCENELMKVIDPVSPDEIIDVLSQNGFSLLKKIKVKIDERHDLYGFVFGLK